MLGADAKIWHYCKVSISVEMVCATRIESSEFFANERCPDRQLTKNLNSLGQWLGGTFNRRKWDRDVCNAWGKFAILGAGSVTLHGFTACELVVGN